MKQLKSQIADPRQAALALCAAREIRREAPHDRMRVKTRPFHAREGEARALHHPRHEQPRTLHRRTRGLHTAGDNIAREAEVTVSGDIGVTADRHEQRFVNDGNYGNSRSWMSNEVGKGWVMVEFAQEHEIDRVVWGRDRQGKFKDRLATSYVIETADDSGMWKVVADSDDRQKYDNATAPSLRSPPRVCARTKSPKRCD
jgi:hypothetical protein